MKRKKRSNDLSDQIRQIIDDCGFSRYRIAKSTGIDESALGKFYNGQRGLSTTNLDRLGRFLDLCIVMKGK